MKAALIADIHGNSEALRGVLEDARAHGAEMFVFLGDYVFDFPDSPQVVDALMNLPNAHLIAGNKEGYLRDSFWDDPFKAGLEQLAVLFETRRLLTEEQRAFLCALPPEKTVSLPSGRRLYCVHSGASIARCPRTEFNSSGVFAEHFRQGKYRRLDYLNGVEAFTRRYMGEALKTIDAGVVAYAHDHLQAHARVDGKLVVRPGSVGLPLDGDTRAAYTLIDDGAREICVEERRVAYDIDAFLARARQSSCYRRGWRWSELIYAELRRGTEIVSFFFQEARALARERGEDESNFGNEVFREAFDRMRARGDI